MDLMDRKAVGIQRHAQRIDQKRLVVRDQLHDRVGALPAMLFQRWRIHTKTWLGIDTVLDEMPYRQRRAVQIFHLTFGQVTG